MSLAHVGGLLLSLAAPVHAQTAADAPHERTGPGAEPPILPAWASPHALPSQAPAADDKSQPVTGGEQRVRSIVVVGDFARGGGIPVSSWRPPEGSAAALRLDHRPGEALDAAWIRRQFALNGLPGSEGRVSAALALVQSINRALVTAGFVNSGLIVSESSRISNGVLEVRLVEGRLVPPANDEEAISVAFADDDPNGLTAGFIRRRFPAAARTPLSAVAIERDFRLLAESPAIRTINADLRPGARPGEASLHLLVEPARRGDVSFGYANDRSPAVGSERLSAAGYLRNALTGGDLITAEIGYTKGVEDAQIAYATPFLSPRTSLNLRGSYNDAAVVDRPLLPLDIRAEERAVEGGIVHRLIEEPLAPTAVAGRWTPSRTLSAGLLVAYRDQRSFLFGEPFSFAPGSKDGRSRYGALRLTGDYLVRGVREVLAVSATATMGLGGTRSDIPGILNPDPNFLAGLVQINYARRLGGSGLEVRARLAGQLASGILYSGERLSIGGQSSVRGYRENLFLVDEGAIGGAELAWNFNLAGRAAAQRRFEWGSFSLSGFADAAFAHNQADPQPPRRFIASLGAGLAWTPSDALQLSIVRGEALRDVPRSGSRDLQDRGWHFRLTVRPLRLLGT
ncbi:ShlB/FhaC/HecB family hemolysin secretion/activation protein [Sphingosinicella sp. BN140058]|uniref:ShlB/FhaC/HecB family hemolysin secretion/activation protein n=1 Tax=Sphingosinicella sp. BN140058 TaxID=1892855 RepID=UPI001010232C|nr:ShlB/FhaC/HecB family hemolysin secretion/activation protein [Sphingosinicella sp. BN140058]QAY77220.1 ShlB/FhaC/HecB family hemolysin secretion/activation protein [Sphingosinicella sp. BN140058]